MYEAPKLEKFGTFRQLTLGPGAGKNKVGDDLIPGVGLDCDGKAPPGDPRGCINGRS